MLHCLNEKCMTFLLPSVTCAAMVSPVTEGGSDTSGEQTECIPEKLHAQKRY